MELEKYKVGLDPQLGLILVEHPTISVSLDKLNEIRKTIENSTNRKYFYGILKTIPGYYFSYVLENHQVIVCGRMNKQECINETKEFIKKIR